MSEPCRVGVGLLAFALCLSVPVTARADVTVSLADGRATIVARNATLRQVLAEWARVGGTRIVNLERVAGAPDNFELRNVPEAKALATLLRSVAGLHRRAAARGLARRVDLRPHPDPAHERRQRAHGPAARRTARRPRRSTSPRPTRPRSPTTTRARRRPRPPPRPFSRAMVRTERRRGRPPALRRR